MTKPDPLSDDAASSDDDDIDAPWNGGDEDDYIEPQGK
jgi:hypothetical protein